MIVRAAGEPRLNLWGFVGGIVIQDDMDIEPFGDLSIDLFEEVQELGRPVTLVAFADDEPRGSARWRRKLAFPTPVSLTRSSIRSSARTGTRSRRPILIVGMFPRAAAS